MSVIEVAKLSMQFMEVAVPVEEPHPDQQTSVFISQDSIRTILAERIINCKVQIGELRNQLAELGHEKQGGLEAHAIRAEMDKEIAENGAYRRIALELDIDLGDV